MILFHHTDLIENLMMTFFFKQLVNTLFYFIYSFFAKRHLGCFHFLPVLNKAALSMLEQVSLEKDGMSFGCMYKRSITEH